MSEMSEMTTRGALSGSSHKSTAQQGGYINVWYAIRTKPGVQQPRREYWTETTPSAIEGRARGKGYRIVSSVNPAMSAVETALNEAGISHWMPAEYDVVRNRHRKGLYEIRRFALLKCWMFVADLADADWGRLMAVDGVTGVASNDGRPYPINPMDLFRLRMIEANSKVDADAKAKRMTSDEDNAVRSMKKTIARNARKKLHAGRTVKLIWGDKVGREATVQAWRDHEHVDVLVNSLDGADTITVPYEYLKAS